MRPMGSDSDHVDVAMVGTFSAWRLGTLQSRALPLAIALRDDGIRCAIVTVPWDQTSERGIVDSIAGVPLVNTRSASVLKSAFAVAEQVSATRRLNPRLVHVFKPKGFGAVTSALLRDRPVLVDSDDWEGDGGWNKAGSYNLAQRRIFDYQERSLLRCADGVTAASTLLVQRAKILRSDRSADSVHHVPNGLASDWVAQFAATHDRAVRSQAPERTRIVLYSRFAEFPPSWLTAFATALSNCNVSEVELVVVGDSGSGRCGRVGVVKMNLMGYVARDSIPSILNSASIALYPYHDSLISRSKHSVKLLELMAAGCAVVASDVGDVATVLGDAGALVNGTNPNVFARTVEALIQQPRRLHAMRLAGPSRVNSHYVIDSVARGLNRVYRSYLNSTQ